jgi:hypothetical protein
MCGSNLVSSRCAGHVSRSGKVRVLHDYLRLARVLCVQASFYGFKCSAVLEVLRDGIVAYLDDQMLQVRVAQPYSDLGCQSGLHRHQDLDSSSRHHGAPPVPSPSTMSTGFFERRYFDNLEVFSITYLTERQVYRLNLKRGASWSPGRGRGNATTLGAALLCRFELPLDSLCHHHISGVEG